MIKFKVDNRFCFLEKTYWATFFINSVFWATHIYRVFKSKIELLNQSIITASKKKKNWVTDWKKIQIKGW